MSSFGPLAQDPAHTAHLHILHNTFCLPSPLPPTKKKNCMTFAGITVVPRELKGNAYATFWGQARCIMGDEQMANIERFHMTSVGVPKQKSSHVVTNQSCGSWTFFLFRNFLLFRQICIAAEHLTEKALLLRRYFSARGPGSSRKDLLR